MRHVHAFLVAVLALAATPAFADATPPPPNVEASLHAALRGEVAPRFDVELGAPSAPIFLAQLDPVPDAAVQVEQAAPAPAAVPSAQPAAAPAPMPTSAARSILETVLTVLVPTVFLPLLTWISVLLGNFIKAKVKNERVAGILERVDAFVADNVRQVAQTYVAAMKASGGFNAQAQASAKQQVLAQLKAHLGAQGIEEITAILGISNVEAFLATKVEATVHEVANPPAAPVTVNVAPLVAPVPAPAAV